MDSTLTRDANELAVEVQNASFVDIARCAELMCMHSGGTHADRAAALSEYVGDPARCLLVAFCAGRILGYAKADHFIPAPDASPDVAPAGYYLSGIVVDPATRRGGIGSALTLARLRWIKARANEAWYFTNANNEASLELHATFGFVEVTRSFTYPGVWFDGGVGVLCRAPLRN